MTSETQSQETESPDDRIIAGDSGEASIKMVQIAPGVSIRLEQFRAAADPLCRFCSRGIVTRIENRKRAYVGCQCAARKLRQEMRVARSQVAPERISTVPSVHVEKDPAVERQRLDKRLGALRSQTEAIEARVRERTQEFEAALREAEAACRVSENLCGLSVARVAEQEVQLGNIKTEMERRIADYEGVLAEERELLAARENGKAQAAAALDRARSTLVRVLRDTEGARRRAENLRRRIASIEARHADVLKDGESC